MSFVTGMPAQRETTSAISSAVTSSRRSCEPPSFWMSASCSRSFFSRSGMRPYLSCEAFALSPAASAASNARRASSSFARTLFTSSSEAFSFFQRAVIASAFAFSSASSLRSSSRRFFEASSVSFASAISSISRRRTWREISSSSAGQESISVRIEAHASSRRSIALSGRKRSWM